jgi:hypothetical protein
MDNHMPTKKRDSLLTKKQTNILMYDWTVDASAYTVICITRLTFIFIYY